MDSKKSLEATGSPSKNVTEKVIYIEICRNCTKHNLSTWHDEAKYKKNFLELKASIEKECPDVQVLPHPSEAPKLGACEVYHGTKPLYSKIKSGLWPNAKAVAQRVAAYFKDLEAGKDVSVYSAGVETKYVPVKKPNTSAGRSRYMGSTHRSGGGLSPDTRTGFYNPGTNSHKTEDHEGGETNQSKKKDGEDPFEFNQEEPQHKEEPHHEDHHHRNEKSNHTEEHHKEPKHEEPKPVEHKTPKHEEVHHHVSPKKEEIPVEEHHKTATPKKENIPKQEPTAEELHPKTENKHESQPEEPGTQQHHEAPVEEKNEAQKEGGHQESKPKEEKEEDYEGEEFNNPVEES